MSNKDQKWYILLKGHKSGPHSSSRMREMLDTGGISPEDLLWRKGYDNWKPARETEFFKPGGRGTGREESGEGDAWYYMRGDRKLGPFSTAAMEDSIRKGIILPNENIFSRCRQRWVRADQQEDFAAASEEARKLLEGELWYYKKDGDIKGPFSFVQLREHLRTGKLKKECPVFSKKLGKWEPLSSVPRLRYCLNNDSNMENK